MSQAKQPPAIKQIVQEPPATRPVTQPAPSGEWGQRLALALTGWGREEGRQWRRILGSPAALALLVFSLLALGLAWQVPFGYTLDSSTELKLDQPFLQHFNALENTDTKTLKGDWYRWSKGDGEIEFTGVGRQAFWLQLNVAGSANPNPTYVLYANDTKLAEGRLESGLKNYQFDIPASAISYKTGDLNIRLSVPTFPSPGDPRDLGFAFFSAKLDPVPSGLVAPPLESFGWLVGLALLVYLLVGRAGFGAWQAAGGGALAALVMAGVVASPGGRPWLTIFTTQLAYAFAWAIVLLVLLAIPMRKVWGSRWETRWTLLFFGLALALRLAATLHPQAGGSVVDLGFHNHRMAAFWDNHLWWDKIESAEWGGRLTYYPLTVHFLAGLFQWLIPDRNLLLLTWMQAFEASRVLLIFYLVKKATGDGRSAVLAGFFMAALPVNMLSLAWGQVSNLFAEWLVTVGLCIVVVKWEQLRRPALFITLVLTILASLITHPGEVVLAGLVFLAVGLVFWRVQGWPAAKIYLAAYLLAIGLAFASYHWVTVQDMVPQAIQSFSDRLQGKPAPAPTGGKKLPPGIRVGGSVQDARLGLTIKYVQGLPDVLIEGVKGFWREARVYFDLFPVLMLPWGLWWLWRTRRRGDQYDPARQRLFWAGLVWTAVAVTFALVGLFLNLYVRYSLFMLPFVAVGAGLFLGRLYQRQPSGLARWSVNLLTVALALWISLGTLTTLLDRVIYYLHGP